MFLVKIEIPEEVTKIGNFVFEGCTSLNTLIEKRGAKSFQGFIVKDEDYTREKKGDDII